MSAVKRPSVDVVVPFHGDERSLETVRARLAALELRPGDTVVVVDNTRGHAPVAGPVPVIHAADRQTPGFARNRGAATRGADWILFLDADVVPPPDLLDRYFDRTPGERTGVLGGGVSDEEVPAGAPVAARYAYLRALMSQDDTFRLGERGFPKTANAAFRREAFEAVGGFREEIRSAEDADLTYRLRETGWEVERREEARVIHVSRRTVRALVAQKLRHGAGAAWLDRRYPGVYPPHRRPGLVWWAVRHMTKGLLAAARSRDRDKAVWAVCDPLELLAVEFGRLLPNERRPRRPSA